MNIESSTQWEVLPRDGTRGAWKKMCVSLTAEGRLRICSVTMKALGRPLAFLVLYDRHTHRIGLKPSPSGVENAYPAGKRAQSPGRVLYLARLLEEFGIQLPRTVRFVNPRIENGILLLDLRTAAPLAGRSKQ